MDNQEKHILRPRVADLLSRGIKNSCVLIRSTSGFGKSAIVSEYLNTIGYHKVWYTCSTFDNEEDRFFYNLSDMFKKHRLKLGKIMEKMGFPDNESAFFDFLNILTKELYTDKKVVAFVFDNFHLITNKKVKRFVLQLINSNLENCCFFVLSRKWEIFDESIVVPYSSINNEDLKYTDDEAIELFNAIGKTVSDESVKEINQYVEGWPIALYLIAKSMSQKIPISITPIIKTKRMLFSLFETILFSQYTDKEKRHLINISILDSFPRELVCAVSNENRSLNDLIAGNIFFDYDNINDRLYIHPLYLEFLKEKRISIPKSQQEKTLLKAAEWCLRKKHYYDAINYFKAFDCHTGVWNTILKFKTKRYKMSEADFLLKCIDDLPKEFIAANPMAEIIKSGLLANNLRFDEAFELIAGVQRKLEAANATELLGECYATYAVILLLYGADNFGEYFKKANGLLSNGSTIWSRHFLAVDLGPGFQLHDDNFGALTKSLNLYTEGVPYMVEVLNGAGEGLELLCRSESAFLQGDIKRTLEFGYQALYKAHAMSQWDIIGNALLILLRCYAIQGNHELILETLEHVDRYKRDPQSSNLGIWDIIYGWYYSEIGEADKVVLWIRNAIQYGYPPVSIDRATVLRTRCLISKGQYWEAKAFINQCATLAKNKNSIIHLIHIEILNSIILYELSEKDASIKALERAYLLAYKNKLLTPFVEYSSRLRKIILYAKGNKNHNVPKEWLDGLYRKVTTVAKKYSVLIKMLKEEQHHKTNLKLSKRELEILLNLSYGYTREEIAEHLYLGVNTVKGVLKQIYAKLGAINGADAVRIAIINKLI